VGEYRFVEDVAIADCAIELSGRDLYDLFETAAAALTALMVDPATVPADLERSVVLEAEALDLLLHDWLSEIIFLKDAERQLYTECRARVSGAGPYRVDAQLTGGVIEPGRTALGADAKAVTLHQLSVEAVPDGWRARVVIDI
jgi:SHS2 domain-containing protein